MEKIFRREVDDGAHFFLLEMSNSFALQNLGRLVEGLEKLQMQTFEPYKVFGTQKGDVIRMFVAAHEQSPLPALLQESFSDKVNWSMIAPKGTPPYGSENKTPDLLAG